MMLCTESRNAARLLKKPHLLCCVSHPTPPLLQPFTRPDWAAPYRNCNNLHPFSRYKYYIFQYPYSYSDLFSLCLLFQSFRPSGSVFPLHKRGCKIMERVFFVCLFCENVSFNKPTTEKDFTVAPYVCLLYICVAVGWVGSGWYEWDGATFTWICKPWIVGREIPHITIWELLNGDVFK